MQQGSSLHRSLRIALCLGLFLGAAGTFTAFTPSVEAVQATDCGMIRAQIRKVKNRQKKAKRIRNASRKRRVLKRLKKKVRKLRRELTACLATPPFIEMVAVGNPGNAADPEDGDNNTDGVQNFGAVADEFQIGKYEVNLDQYAEFLNAVAATDTYDLYNAGMGTDQNIAGIQQNGSAPNFTYTVIGSGKRPVTYVSWFDAARFCNWLHNGCPKGAQDASTTERGAYTLDGATSGVNFPRQAGAKYFIPSENQWYKAAYHDPRSEASGGPPGDDQYWLYPTMSDTVPDNVIGPGTNQANFYDGAYSVTQEGTRDANQNYLTDGGTYPGSASYYGTFDQGGNVHEWTEAVIDPPAGSSNRGGRGGAWTRAANVLSSHTRFRWAPFDSDIDLGFRVASPAP